MTFEGNKLCCGRNDERYEVLFTDIFEKKRSEIRKTQESL